jgi:hypothetical protein
MDFLLPLTGLLILLAGGLGVALLIIPRDRAPAVSEVLSLSLLCGAGLIFHFLFSFSVFFYPGVGFKPLS